MEETKTLENELVFLKCIKEHSKLRIKVISTGYLLNANCQFPKDLRVEGRIYSVHRNYISLVKLRNTYFYSVKIRSAISVVSDYDSKQSETKIDVSKIKVHTDEDSNECIICMSNEKTIVFGPCGHFYSCNECSNKLTKCPICRGLIINRIDQSEFSTL